MIKKVNQVLEKNSIHYDELGTVDAKILSFSNDIKLPIEELKEVHKYWLTKYMDS